MTVKMYCSSLLALACSALALSACEQSAGEQLEMPGSADPQASNYASQSVEDRRLLWGDTHLHTRNSADAYENGLVNADIDTAYRFARGETVLHPRLGTKVRIDRPLDFIVVADHAEALSISQRLIERNPILLGTEAGKALLARFLEDPNAALYTTQKFDPTAGNSPTIQAIQDPRLRQLAWDDQIDAAERYNEPGKFTSFIGWEWSATPGGLNLHRVVFTPTDGETARQFLPLSNYDTMRPEELWQFLRQTQARTGAEFLAIPHNSNFSNGLMFSRTDSDGNPIDAAYARERMTWETVAEVTQYKGTSETYPLLSPRDEFAGFELRRALLGPGEMTFEEGSFLRPSLGTGLDIGARVGVNPFALGMIGSTDSHTGFSSVEEDNFLGKSGSDILPAERVSGDTSRYGSWGMSAGGLAAVWADRNDRQSIFQAFRRREVYATTGPRIRLRVFAGYGYEAGNEMAKDFAAIGYRHGVPMGGELFAHAQGRAPLLLIRTVKDPDGANLDRVQVVKGWRSADGTIHEKIYDVAWSDARKPGADGKLPAVGNTVNLETARYTNAIGAAELATLWRDPDFDSAQPAYYYLRVLQIPTPRHNLYDAIALGLDPATLEQPATIQERAWSSPIWYRP